jgi:antitoxin VapB
MAEAKLFKSGNSQAVRLPKEYRMRGPVVEVYRRGDEIVLREKTKGLSEALRILAEMPQDVFDNIGSDGPPQDREW